MIAVRYNEPEFVAQVEGMLGRVKKPSALLKVLGRELANQHKWWFRQKQKTEPNKLGGERTNFWAAVSASVQSPVIVGDNDGIKMSINHPAIAQKVLGGKISAKRSKALTLPLQPESYGMTASTFEHEHGVKLFVLRFSGASAFLAFAEASGHVKIEYLLKSAVNQKPDDDALPPKAAMLQVIIARGTVFIARQDSANPAP